MLLLLLAREKLAKARYKNHFFMPDLTQNWPEKKEIYAYDLHLFIEKFGKQIPDGFSGFFFVFFEFFRTLQISARKMQIFEIFWIFLSLNPSFRF